MTFKKIYKLIFLSGLLMAGLLSCIPDPVEIEVPQAEPKLVVASQMVFNQGVLIQLSKSFSALTGDLTEGDSIPQDSLDLFLVDSALLVITGPDGADTLFRLQPSLYLGIGTELIPNETYNLYVKDYDSDLEAFAQTQVLEVAVFDSVKSFEETVEFSFGDSTIKDTLTRLAVSFEDLPGESYYMINLYNLSTQEDPSEFDIFSSGDGSDTYFYSDALLTEDLFRDTLDFPAASAGDTVVVTLSHISQDYFDYLNTRSRSGSSFFASLLGEPVSFPTNVENGYGFFNLHFPTARLMVIE
jgi:hypothetical protein